MSNLTYEDVMYWLKDHESDLSEDPVLIRELAGRLSGKGVAQQMIHLICYSHKLDERSDFGEKDLKRFLSKNVPA